MGKYLDLNLYIYPCISPSIHHRSCASGKLTNRKRRLHIYTLEEIPKGLSTANHVAGKLSIPPVLAWFENGRYFEVAWRRRPLICVLVQSFTSSFTVRTACGTYSIGAPFEHPTLLSDKILLILFPSSSAGFSF